MVTLISAPQAPSLEPARDAIVTATKDLFDDAATAIDALFGSPSITLAEPTLYQFIGSGYMPPSDFPAVLIGASNLHRVGAGNAAQGGNWNGSLEIHIWLQGDDTDTLTRSLDRYAALMWMVVLSADAARTLGGAMLLPETMKIAPYDEASQSLAQRVVVLGFDVTVRA